MATRLICVLGLCTLCFGCADDDNDGGKGRSDGASDDLLADTRIADFVPEDRGAALYRERLQAMQMNLLNEFNLKLGFAEGQFGFTDDGQEDESDAETSEECKDFLSEYGRELRQANSMLNRLNSTLYAMGASFDVSKISENSYWTVQDHKMEADKNYSFHFEMRASNSGQEVSSRRNIYAGGSRPEQILAVVNDIYDSASSKSNDKYTLYLDQASRELLLLTESSSEYEYEEDDGVESTDGSHSLSRATISLTEPVTAKINGRTTFRSNGEPSSYATYVVLKHLSEGEFELSYEFDYGAFTSRDTLRIQHNAGICATLERSDSDDSGDGPAFPQNPF